MSAPPLGLGELGGAFCLYQRTEVFFPFRRGGRAGPGLLAPEPEPRGFSYKRPARPPEPPSLGALHSLGQINTQARLQGCKGEAATHPFPPSPPPERVGTQPLSPSTPASLENACFRGALFPRRDGNLGRAFARRGGGHGARGSRASISQPPDPLSETASGWILNFFAEEQRFQSVQGTDEMRGI